MCLDRLFALLCRLVNRKPPVALAPVPVRVVVRLILALAILSLSRTAFATVGVTLNVSPFDNPFPQTPGGPNPDEGIPSDGNSVQPFQDPAAQTFFEGRDNGLQTNNLNFSVFAGITSSGTLLIDGGSALRDEDLIIGNALRYKSSPSAQNLIGLGAGTVRITDTGSLYNNNPSIIPSGLPSNFGSVSPRTADDSSGFDLYVGTANKDITQYQTNLTQERSGTTISAAPLGVGGSGTLAISAGGAAEIEDSVVVGDVAGSTGSITVDGNDSFLGSGGYQLDTNDPSDPHRMVIGRQGTGSLSITNGGTVQVVAPGNGTTSGANVNMAATIGDMPYVSGTASTTPGGFGTVTVGSTNASTSSWLIAGSLQVGGFVDNPSVTPGGSFTDLTGVASVYTTRQGQGKLTVQSGGLVNVNLAPGINPNQDSPLFVAVGYLGQIVMAGGTLSVGEVNNTGTTSRQDQIQVVNDGVITGSGTILTGVFRNRYLGRVIVNPGDTLHISATSNFPTGATTNAFYPLDNFGLIEVTGTQDARATLDFQRPVGNSNTGALPGQPLVNQPVVTTSTQFSGGIIQAQWATIRSGSGILNNGVIAFTGGSNIVQGQLSNSVGSVLAIGPNASVVVEDQCNGCSPTFVAFGNTLQIIDPFTWTSAGVITLPLSKNNPNLIAAAGDIAISGTIKIPSLSSDVIADLKANGPGVTYPVISFGGQAYQTKLDSNNVAHADTSKVIPDCTGLSSCFVPGLGVSLAGPTLATLFGPAFNNFVPVAERIGGSIVIGFLNPGASGASGPDFNGDGVVNSLDFQIWQENVGITSGATVLQGDANGDGRVDGQDFLIWQSHLGPYPGAGSGSSFQVIPEPTSIALLLMSGLAWLPIRRRRAG